MARSATTMSLCLVIDIVGLKLNYSMQWYVPYLFSIMPQRIFDKKHDWYWQIYMLATNIHG